MKRLLILLLLPSAVQAQNIQDDEYATMNHGWNRWLEVVAPRHLANECIPAAMRTAKGKPTKEGKIRADSLVKAYKTFYKLVQTIRDTSTIRPIGFHYEGDSYVGEVAQTYTKFLEKGGACDVKLFPTIEYFLAVEHRYREKFAAREKESNERSAHWAARRDIDNAQVTVEIKEDLAVLAKAEYLFRRRNGVFTGNALLLRPFIAQPLQSTRYGNAIITIETSFDYNEQVTIVIQLGPVRCGADVLPDGQYRTTCL